MGYGFMTSPAAGHQGGIRTFGFTSLFEAVMPYIITPYSGYGREVGQSGGFGLAVVAKNPLLKL